MIMKIRTAAAVLLISVVRVVSPTVAIAYPVDCAILLCLPGGWPASAECSHARAVFIRRITPWPIEPPLQIWRCPLNWASRSPVQNSFANRLFSAAVKNMAEPQFTPAVQRSGAEIAEELVQNLVASKQADVDISGPEFDFVRSIRVFHIQYTRIVGRDRECTEYDQTVLGSYGAQGEFAWAGFSYGGVPDWYPKRTNRCGLSSERAVAIEWRDYEGNLGHEFVRY